MVHIVGGGLAGCEAAWQAALLGVRVTMYEMRPVQPTAVHQTDRLAELVCSNSFRGDKLDNAVGLLKEEMRRLDSLIMRVADQVRVPAGAALAVDREKFAEGVTAAIAANPLIHVERREIPQIPACRTRAPVIVATGPLTSPSLSSDIAAFWAGPIWRSSTRSVRSYSPIRSRCRRYFAPAVGTGVWARSSRRRLPQLSLHARGFTSASTMRSSRRKKPPSMISTTRSFSRAAFRLKSWRIAASTRFASAR